MAQNTCTSLYSYILSNGIIYVAGFDFFGGIIKLAHLGAEARRGHIILNSCVQSPINREHIIKSPLRRQHLAMDFWKNWHEVTFLWIW